MILSRRTGTHAAAPQRTRVRMRVSAINPDFFNKYMAIMCSAFPKDACLENINGRPFPAYENQEAVLETFHGVIEAASAIPPPSIMAAILELIIRGDKEQLGELMAAFEKLHGILENLGFS